MKLMFSTVAQIFARLRTRPIPPQNAASGEPPTPVALLPQPVATTKAASPTAVHSPVGDCSFPIWYRSMPVSLQRRLHSGTDALRLFESQLAVRQQLDFSVLESFVAATPGWSAMRQVHVVVLLRHFAWAQGNGGLSADYGTVCYWASQRPCWPATLPRNWANAVELAKGRCTRVLRTPWGRSLVGGRA